MTEIQRYGCSRCGYTLHAPVGVSQSLRCPSCARKLPSEDAVLLDRIAPYGPVPGVVHHVDPEEKLAVNVQTRLSQGMADRIDALRGERSRSEWVRDRLTHLLLADA